MALFDYSKLLNVEVMLSGTCDCTDWDDEDECDDCDCEEEVEDSSEQWYPPRQGQSGLWFIEHIRWHDSDVEVIAFPTKLDAQMFYEKATGQADPAVIEARADAYVLAMAEVERLKAEVDRLSKFIVTSSDAAYEIREENEKLEGKVRGWETAYASAVAVSEKLDDRLDDALAKLTQALDREQRAGEAYAYQVNKAHELEQMVAGLTRELATWQHGYTLIRQDCDVLKQQNALLDGVGKNRLAALAETEGRLTSAIAENEKLKGQNALLEKRIEHHKLLIAALEGEIKGYRRELYAPPQRG